MPLNQEENQNVQIKIKTSHGLTVEQTLKENVLQGDTLSSIIASNQVDTIGKKLLKENPDFLLRYKDEVPIRVLAMVDDTLTITEAGHKTQHINAFSMLNLQKKYFSSVNLSVIL